MANTTTKRKRPPTFQHYPKKRAKTLKAQWVERAKIKSKWKVQKRKEGLVTRPALKKDGSNHGEEETNSVVEHLDTISQANSSEYGDTASEPELPSAEVAPSVPDENRRKRGLPASRGRAILTNKHTGDAKARPKKTEEYSERLPNLRDRAREAYSPATLHTYKSASFQKRGHARGGRAGTRGRGQPNMKLRMGVMLEQIKQKYL